ncbi:MAG: hypothetical protein K2O12_00530 [Muribaculaceae bacterium]|nr:hypothetical protein [Muribaculaceae bacterium]
MKDILFYYPQHFNRTKNATNPFFDKMLEICDRHKIEYDLFEEPDSSTDKPRNPKAKKSDKFFWMVTVFRKLVTMFMPRKDFFYKERYVASLINIFTLGRYRRKVYITISGSMYHLFSYLNPKADVYDMQHGVLYKHHPTFFDSETLRLKSQFYRPNLHMIFWGKGYRDCFVKGEEAHMRGKAHVLGYPVDLLSDNIESNIRDNSGKNEIVVSLQFTHSVCYEELEKMKRTLCSFLEQTSMLSVKVLLKHHPRYNNSINIDDLVDRFDNVEITDLSFEELLDRVSLHVTYFSTTAFEFAQYGIPTFFLPYEDKKLNQTLYYDEYNYPLYLNNTIGGVVTRLTDSGAYKEDSETVKKWYLKFYSPFDEKEFIKLIRRG